MDVMGIRTLIMCFIGIYIDKSHQTGLTMLPPGSSIPVVMGQSKTLSVVSDTDMVRFQWYHNNSLISTDTTNRTHSSYIINSTSFSTGGNYSCTGTPNNGSTLTAVKNIVIYYISDGVTIQPSYRPYKLSVYQTNIPLRCIVNGNPPPTIKWTQGTPPKTVSTTQTYQISTVHKGTAGTYNCTGTNEAGIRSNSITVEVQYGPEITTPNNKSIAEGQNLLVICSVSANPPVSTVWWSRQGDSSFTQNNRQLSITNIQRGMKGRYFCNANNTIQPSGQASQQRSNSKSLDIDVTYGPGNSVSLNTPGGVKHITLTEGVPADKVTCSAVCNPPCSFTWSRQNKNFPNPLTLTGISKSTAGTYRCRAYNSISSSYTDLNVTVLYSPSVQFSIDGGQSKNETDETNFRCIIDGNPQSNVVIRSMENETFSFTRRDTNTFKVKIDQVTCLDSGPYQCLANNSIGEIATGNIILYVYCKPRLDVRVYENAENEGSIFEEKIENGGILNISIDLIAYPKPNVRWIFRDRSGKYTEMADRLPNFNTSIESSKLVIHRVKVLMLNITEADYGEYSAVVKNNRGNIIITYIVTEKSNGSDSNDLGSILGGVIGSIVFLIIVVILVVIIMRRRGVGAKDCKLCEHHAESENLDAGPIYANQTFATDFEKIQSKKDSAHQLVETSKRTNYEKTLPSGEEHPYETPVTSRKHTNQEGNYANVNAGAKGFNTEESAYANVETEEQNKETNQQESKKYLYENTEPTIISSKNKKRKGKQ